MVGGKNYLALAKQFHSLSRSAGPSFIASVYSTNSVKQITICVNALSYSPIFFQMDVHAFLFSDMLLVCKHLSKKQAGTLDGKVRVIRPPYVIDRLVAVDLQPGGGLGPSLMGAGHMHGHQYQYHHQVEYKLGQSNK